MALGQMKDLGRFPANPATFDERFRGTQPDFIKRLNPDLQGQIEDRTQMNEAELIAAENQSRRDRAIFPQPEPQVGTLAEQAGAKDLKSRTRASIGVAGGSR